MRIVVDMQGAQTESRFRGIGRYAMSLTEAMVRNRGNHEIILALSGLFPATIEPIRAAFDELLPQENIRVWYAPGPVREIEPSNRWRREVAERIREAFLLSLRPDIVLITSLFEGLGDDAVTSVGIFDHDTPTAVILHDLIPLIRPDVHFRTSSTHRSYYARKIASLTRSHCLLANSESSRQEATSALSITEGDVVTISAGCDPVFRQVTLSASEKNPLCSRLGISPSFIMYTGGADERKNLHRLIEAYASLPNPLRSKGQLVLVGKMPEDYVAALRETARQNSLRYDDVVFTGYVTDDELLQLYNYCKLFIFPSLHEGFGMPPLEAMACGAPVIASRATSLPEIVGRDDALFDPESVSSIRDKMAEVLEREAFRNGLINHGLEQVKKFSWDMSAQKALGTLEKFALRCAGAEKGSVPDDESLIVENTSLFCAQVKKILLIKLDHMGDLLLAVPAISRLHARYPQASIDIVVGSWNVPIAQSLKLFRNVYQYDFFRKSSIEAPALNDAELSTLLDKLERYDIAIDLRRPPDTRFLLGKISAGLKVGYATLDPQLDSTLNISLKTYLDLPFHTTPLNATHISKQLLKLVDGLPKEVTDYVALPSLEGLAKYERVGVALFPKAGNAIKEWDIRRFHELSQRLAQTDAVEEINIYFASAEDARSSGFNTEGKIQVRTALGFSELTQSLKKNAICVANNSFGAHIAGYLGLTVLAIYGGHETAAEWGPPFGNSYVIRRDVACSPCHHAHRSDCREGMRCLNISVDFVYGKTLEALRSLAQTAAHNGRARTTINTTVSPKIVENRLIQSIVNIPCGTVTGQQATPDGDLIRISEAIAHSLGRVSAAKQLLVDVSEIVHHDAGTGIQRVVRSILKEWLNQPTPAYRVEPVYATMDHGYRYARHFVQKFFGRPDATVADEPIEYEAGDVFFGLDLQPDVIPRHREFYQELRRQGVRVVFGLHDLLCIQMPQYFPPVTAKVFSRWLEVVAESDGVVCVSKTVAEQVAEWLREHGPSRQRPFKIGWSHNGADIENSAPTTGFPPDAVEVLQAIVARPSFLMVGTVEPRKGHSQALTAFGRLWKTGREINLVVAGRKGWGVDKLMIKLCAHPELKKRLFWLDGISDEYLEEVYEACDCLIAASEGEGFGLPLIEGARHKLPIIARDIPVFREVAAEHAFYFSGNDPANLADAIERWLALYEADRHPKSDTMPWITWAQSAKRLKDILLRGEWYTTIAPNAGITKSAGTNPNSGQRREPHA